MFLLGLAHGVLYYRHDTRHGVCVSPQLKAAYAYKYHQDYNWLKEQCCENLMNIAQILAEI